MASARGSLQGARMPHVCAALPQVTWASPLLAGELLEPAPFMAPEAWRCACPVSNCTGNTVPTGTRRSGITCGLCPHGPHRLLAHRRAPDPQPVLDSPTPLPRTPLPPSAFQPGTRASLPHLSCSGGPRACLGPGTPLPGGRLSRQGLRKLRRAGGPFSCDWGQRVRKGRRSVDSHVYNTSLRVLLVVSCV